MILVNARKIENISNILDLFFKIGDLGISKVKKHTLGVRGTLTWMAPVNLLAGRVTWFQKMWEAWSLEFSIKTSFVFLRFFSFSNLADLDLWDCYFFNGFKNLHVNYFNCQAARFMLVDLKYVAGGCLLLWDCNVGTPDWRGTIQRNALCIDHW